MALYDLIIKGGTLVDGTGAPRKIADICIADGVVQKIGADVPASRGRKVINASGRIVAPGVIDPHTHYDAQIHWDPYCANSSWHGATSVVVGNCGFGFMPCRPEDRERYMRMMENTEQVSLSTMRKVLSWDWESFPSWMEHMKGVPKGVNIAAYMPLNSLLMYVMGAEEAKKRPATRQERQRMRDLLNEAMDAGAIGFGFSHLANKNSHKDCDGTPMPTDIMSEDDIYNLGEVLRERDQGAIQAFVDMATVSKRHVVEELARISRRPILHNVIMAFDALPDNHLSLLRWLDEMEVKGYEIYSQALAYRFWIEFNPSDFNDWNMVEPFGELINSGDGRARAKKAADPDFRVRARKSYDPAVMAGLGGSVESLTLQRANDAKRFAKYEGRTVGQIAAAEGCAGIDVYLDLVAESGALADFKSMAVTSEDPQKIAAILKHKRVLPGTSDGGAHLHFLSGGQYPTDNIMQMAREEGLMSLEELHYKLSWLPARVLGFDKRGALLQGYAADLYIYDYEKLGFNTDRQEVLNDVPGNEWRRIIRARGIDHVIVNGEVIFDHNECTNAKPGRVLGISQPSAQITSAPPSLQAQG
jgi:N-acyl-D-amino-acid deacylase